MSREFDSRKDTHSTKLELENVILESCMVQSNLIYILLIIEPQKYVKNRKVGYKFVRHQSL